MKMVKLDSIMLTKYYPVNSEFWNSFCQQPRYPPLLLCQLPAQHHPVKRHIFTYILVIYKLVYNFFFLTNEKSLFTEHDRL